MEVIKENKISLIIIGVLVILSVLMYFIFREKSPGGNAGVSDYLKNYEINELVPINIDEETIARKYLAEYTDLIFSDPDAAFDLVEEEYRKIKFKNIDEFKEYFTTLVDNNFFNANIEKINVTKFGEYNQFYIIDSSNVTYIFREYSINNYKVMFDTYTI